MTTTVLECRHLRKTYGQLKAVDDISFRIGEGETYGLLGPNGAGKTTAISMVVGILTRDGGEVLIAGQPHDVNRTSTKALIGYVPQELALYPDLNARENLRFFGNLYGIHGAALKQRVTQVLELVGLSDRASERVDKFSGGMARRLHIGVGLLNKPRILILDEPTAGVDPQSRNAILGSVQKLAEEGLAVLYTTHYMEEAERLCDRVGIIDEGQLKAEGTRRELVRMVGSQDEIVLVTDGDPAAAAAALGELPEVDTITREESRIRLMVGEAAALLPTVLATAAGTGTPVRSVEVRQPNLEAVFLHLTGKALRD